MLEGGIHLDFHARSPIRLAHLLNELSKTLFCMAGVDLTFPLFGREPKVLALGSKYDLLGVFWIDHVLQRELEDVLGGPVLLPGWEI